VRTLPWDRLLARLRASRLDRDLAAGAPLGASRALALRAEMLVSAGPVSAQGVAKASVLLADAKGPLYHRASSDDLRARVRDAADALIAARPGSRRRKRV